MITVTERLGTASEALTRAADNTDSLRCFVAVYTDGSTQSFISASCREDAAGMWWLAMMLSTAVADLMNLPLEEDAAETVPEGTVVQ